LSVFSTENIVRKKILMKFTTARKKSEIMLSRHMVRLSFTTPAKQGHIRLYMKRQFSLPLCCCCPFWILTIAMEAILPISRTIYEFFESKHNDFLLHPPEMKHLYPPCQKFFRNELTTIQN